MIKAHGRGSPLKRHSVSVRRNSPLRRGLVFLINLPVDLTAVAQIAVMQPHAHQPTSCRSPDLAKTPGQSHGRVVISSQAEPSNGFGLTVTERRRSSPAAMINTVF